MFQFRNQSPNLTSRFLRHEAALPILHVMVGLPGSGKTTLARQIAAQTGAVRFTPDDWHLRLYGQDLHDPDHDRRHTEIETIQRDLAFDLLAKGVDVILDFGVWARDERNALRAAAKMVGAGFMLHPCDAPIDTLYDRVQSRQGGFAVTMGMLRDWQKVYEPVDETELHP